VEFFDHAAPPGGHVGVFGQKGFTESPAAEGLQYLVAIAEQALIGHGD
jgi:hypothetical protein